MCVCVCVYAWRDFVFRSVRQKTKRKHKKKSHCFALTLRIPGMMFPFWSGPCCVFIIHIFSFACYPAQRLKISLASTRVVTKSVSTPALEYLTTDAEEALVRDLLAKSTYESACHMPCENGKGVTRKDLHVREN